MQTELIFDALGLAGVAILIGIIVALYSGALKRKQAQIDLLQARLESVEYGSRKSLLDEIDVLESEYAKKTEIAKQGFRKHVELVAQIALTVDLSIETIAKIDQDTKKYKEYKHPIFLIPPRKERDSRHPPALEYPKFD